MDLATLFAGRARKYNHFQAAAPMSGHSCQTCVRRRYSYPYTCNDGWKGNRAEQAQRGGRCLNWTGDKNAPVD